MNDNKIKVYMLKDAGIAFSVCPLQAPSIDKSCCINPERVADIDFQNAYICGYGGIHFRCLIHPDTQLRKKDLSSDEFGYSSESVWWCERCATADKNYNGKILNEYELRERAKIIATSKENEYEIIYIDEHTKEIVIEHEHKSPYFSAGKIETDYKGRPLIHLYVGVDNRKDKVHYFIEPETRQLRYEIGGVNHNADPSDIVCEIKVIMKGACITQKYENKNGEEVSQ